MKGKTRLSASVDSDLIAAAQAAVEAGRAPSVSGWVNKALQRQVEHDLRMAALAKFIAAHEAEFGEISEEEMLQATRQLRSRAIAVRGPSSRAGNFRGDKQARKRKSA